MKEFSFDQEIKRLIKAVFECLFAPKHFEVSYDGYSKTLIRIIIIVALIACILCAAIIYTV